MSAAKRKPPPVSDAGKGFQEQTRESSTYSNKAERQESGGGKTQAGRMLDKLRLAVAICGDERIPATQARAAVVALLHFADTKTGRCFPSKPQLAIKACVSPDTIKRMWKRLNFMGYVKAGQSKTKPNNGGRNRRNHYSFNLIQPARPEQETGAPFPPLENDNGCNVAPLSERNGCNDTQETGAPCTTHISNLVSNPISGAAVPLPCGGTAPASPDLEQQAPRQAEKREGIQRGQSSPSEAERERHVQEAYERIGRPFPAAARSNPK
jgi:hypothetical protein